MSEKYELTSETRDVLGRTLYRIRALVAFGDVKIGELGGWVESKSNLSQSGNAWVSGDARVFGKAWVSDNAQVSGNAQVCGSAWICNNAQVSGDAQVYDCARVSGNAQVSGSAWICRNAQVSSDAEIKLDTHLLQIGAIGSRNGFTTFFRTKEKRLFVSCGCFCGSVNEFEEKVSQTHGNNKHAKAYALAIKLAKLQVEDVEVQ